VSISKVWVFVREQDGRPTTTALELLTKARDLAGTVEAFVVGDGAAVAGVVGEHGATRIHAFDAGGRLAGASAAASMAQLVESESPDLILFPMDYDGRDVLGRLSARIDRPVVTDGIDVVVEGDAVRVVKGIFGGTRIVSTAFTGGTPYLGAIRPKSFTAEPSGGVPAEVVAAPTVDVGRAGDGEIVDRHVEEQEGPKLEDAAVVVSGGRGLGAAEHYALIEGLAKLLKGAPGASRAIVDAGWVPYSHQVGQTGKTVKPKVYIACGISGATQHMVGMKGSENIIAVNKDADAPIFSIADLGIVGDVHKVLPKLIEALKAKA
jgi:electron transfer flavoprotein alpha subunit